MLLSNASFNRFAIRLLATPGGPRKKMLSPEMADKSDNAMGCSFSKIPSFMAYNNWVICDFTVFMYF